MGSVVDPLVYTARWRVRSYEIDQNGHVNNAVYLNYTEALTVEHAEASGYGRAWTEAQGGAWVVRRHEVEYLRPARMGRAAHRARLGRPARLARLRPGVRIKRFISDASLLCWDRTR